MTCDKCLYASDAPAYPAGTVRVCTHHSTIVLNNSERIPPRYWSGQEVSMALTVCRGRGFNLTEWRHE